MKAKDNIEKVLSSLDGIERAVAPPQSFSGIQKRLAQQRSFTKKTDKSWIKVAAAIAVVVLSNVWAVSNYWSSNWQVSEATDTYNLIITDFNLYENE